ncbi:MAG: zinc-binding alcohol dehydrogenase [Geminicoccaceae bacterium]|nr:zinc-binding alcohol dehydrogenase [Geminicoccaceae bacterium]
MAETAATCRAYWATAPFEGELREAPLPPPGRGEARVRTRFSGVSRGTEALVARGDVPPGEAMRMRCPFQAGAFPFPVKYGYAAVGTVEAGPDDLLGCTVFCLHPHQDRFVVPADALRPLPKGLPPGRAVLAPNMETALNAVWDAGIGPGERVAVLGAGVVGLLVAHLAAAIPGTELYLADPDMGKAGAAAVLGLRLSSPADLDGLEADRVLDCTGSPEAPAQALALAGFEAEITLVGWLGTAAASLPLGGAFHGRRLALRASQVGAVSPGRRPRWDHARRLDKALDLLLDPRLDALISGETPFAALPETMPRLVRNASGVLCHRIVYA